MKTMTASIILAESQRFSATYDYYIEYDGEYTVVILERARDQEYDYELIMRKPVNDMVQAENAVVNALRDRIKELLTGHIMVFPVLHS